MKNLLPLALQAFRSSFIYKMDEKYRLLKDEHGKYAYLFDDYVLVAKNYEWNGIVSVHKKAWDKCKDLNRILVMFIASPGGLFKFDLKKVRGSYPNLRDGETMINFPFRYGEKIGVDKNFLDNSQSVREPVYFTDPAYPNIKFTKGII